MASQELLDWCARQGVTWHGIESRLVAEGCRGVVATQDLAPDTCILRVPQRLLLTVASARRDPQLQVALAAAGQSLDSTQVLAVHLLHEMSKGEASFWRPYLQSLPRSYATAMCFRAADVEALQVPYAQAVVEAAVEAAAAQWRQALPVLRALQLEPKWLTKQAWLWAASTLSSRTMYVPFDPAGALTPFGDLHNYAPPPPPFTPSLGAAVARPQRPQQGSAAAGGAALQLQQLGLTDAAGGSAGPALQQQEQQAIALPGLRMSRPLQAFRRQEGAQEGPCSGSGNSRGSIGGADRQACSLDAAEPSAATTSGPRTSGVGEERLAVAVGSAINGRLEAEQGRPPSGDERKAAEAAGAAAGAAVAAGEPDGGPAEQAQQLCGDGHLDEAEEEYRIFTRRSYRAGQQVFLCYGRHSNLELLQHYGFVLPTNPHDIALLPPPALPPAVAGQLPGGGAVGGEEGGCYVHWDGAPSWDLLRALRLGTASAAERRDRAYLALQDEPISAECEARALRTLRDACAAALRTLPTTAQQDQGLMDGGSGPAAAELGECGRLAVEWRLRYKWILLSCIARCDAALSVG